MVDKGLHPNRSWGHHCILLRIMALFTMVSRLRLTRQARSSLTREIVTGPQDPKRRYFLAAREHI